MTLPTRLGGRPVREYSVPSSVIVDERETLLDPVLDAARNHPDDVLFRRGSGTNWTDVTAARFAEEVAGVAAGLLAAGVAAGDRVALLSRTRYEWTLLD